MKYWYQNRMESGVTHRGQNIPQGKMLYLTEAQAKLHNGTQEKVAKLDQPLTDSKEVGVLADWNEYQESLKANQKPDPKKSETIDTKGKSSTKAKS